MTGPVDHRPLTRLWRYAIAHRPRIIAATAFSILNKAFDLAPPVLIGMAIDVVVRRQDSFLSRFGFPDTREQLVVLAILTFVIWALESAFEYAYAVTWRNLAQSIQHDLRVDGYAHVQTLDLAYFEDHSTGGLMAILNNDINQLERFLDGGANDMLQVLTTVVLIGAMFFALAPTVAWMAFLPIPFIIWGSFRFQQRIAPRYADVREYAGMINQQLSNNLTGITTIKSFTAEAREEERIAEASLRYQEANQRAIRLSSAFSPLIRIVILIGFTATLIAGGFLTLQGGIEVGAYSVMVFLTQRLLWPLTRLGQTFDLYQRAMASTNRVLDLLDSRASIIDGPTSLPSKSIQGHIEFDHVEFSYDPGFPVIEDLSITIPAGRTTAIVGATGSGKTTLIKLLLRFYDVTGGSIRLEDHDIRELSLTSLRQAIGLVSQDVYLFHGTVRENIAYGKPDAPLDEVIAAAKIAEAHGFILELPGGYESIVGERGQKLSGGQRQRISIARAVLADPPVLILDEATSSVDNETEAAIQRSLELITRNRTTIAIAHRLSTIRHADRIHLLDRGKVVEDGSHDDLIAIDGLYASLWKVQTGQAVAWHVDSPTHPFS
ncbi:MAG: ATP-binding cassette domain-containing protein [Gammaproteobacteria bacterium]|nr:ATP-binding cassette domain-containing protein [Gammaproteobacteria bacterium]